MGTRVGVSVSQCQGGYLFPFGFPRSLTVSYFFVIVRLAFSFRFPRSLAVSCIFVIVRWGFAAGRTSESSYLLIFCKTLAFHRNNYESALGGKQTDGIWMCFDHSTCEILLRWSLFRQLCVKMSSLSLGDILTQSCRNRMIAQITPHLYPSKNFKI